MGHHSIRVTVDTLRPPGAGREQGRRRPPGRHARCNHPQRRKPRL